MMLFYCMKIYRETTLAVIYVEIVANSKSNMVSCIIISLHKSDE